MLEVFANGGGDVIVNESGKYFLLAGDGVTIVEGEGHPDGRTVLCCPGGTVTADVINRVPGLAEKLAAPKVEAKAEIKAVPSSAVENKMVKPEQVENKAKPEPAVKPPPTPAPKAG